MQIVSGILKFFASCLYQAARLAHPLDKNFMSGAKSLNGLPFRQAWSQSFDLVEGNPRSDLFQQICSFCAETDSPPIEQRAISLGFPVLPEPLVQRIYRLGMVQQTLVQRDPLSFFFQIM